MEEVKRPAPASAPAVPAKVYVVQKGDNLWEIAKRHYGNGSYFFRIVNANKGKIKAGFLIHPGQEIVLP